MRASLYFSPTCRGRDEQLPLLEAISDLSREADDAGFAGVFLTEHHLGTHNPFQNSLMYAAYLAAQLEQAYLGLCTVNPTLHQPLRLVEQCNLLDLLTRGRLIVGIGSGYVEDEMRAFGRNPAERNELLGQTLEVLDRLWAFRDGDAPYEFSTLAEAGLIDHPVTPGPYRRDRPILARATLSQETIVKSARLGHPTLLTVWDVEQTRAGLTPYFETLATSGHDPETVAQCEAWTGTMKWIHVAKTDALAREELDQTIDRWVDDLQKQRERRPVPVTQVVSPEFTKLAKTAAAENPRDAFARHAICGSPETVIAKLLEYADAGVGQVMGMFLRDINEAAAAQRSVRLFADEVLPVIESYDRASVAGVS